MNISKIGIVVADIDEFAPLADRIVKGEYKETSFLKRRVLEFSPKADLKIVAIHCGIGKVNAAAAATHLVDIGCEVILNYGLSGGIDKVKRSEICLPDKFIEHDFDISSIGYKPFEKPLQSYIYNSDSRLREFIRGIIPNVKEGMAVTGDCFINDKKLSDFLKNEFGAVTCDMETAAIAYVCEFAEVPFACLRRVSDDAGDDAVDSYREMNTSGETDLSDLALDVASAIAEGFLI